MNLIQEYEEKYNKKINDFIISIYVDEFKHEEHRNELENQDNGIYVKKGGNFWIAFNELNEIIGTIAIVKHDNKNAELKKLYVHKDYRKKGIAKELYKKLIDFCKENSFERIFLGTYKQMESAIRFYLKNGFKEIENISDDNDDAMYFELYI